MKPTVCMVLAVSAACALGGCCHGDKKEEGYKKIEISKLAAAPQKMEGRRLSVSGRLENAGGNYFTDLRPALRDGKGGEIAVNAWLPLGVPPPRPGDTGRDRPRLMSDLLGKKVRLSGVWEKTESGHALRVESDIIIEEER